MKVVLQRVSTANVSVDGKIIASIDHGLLILVGIGHTDDQSQTHQMAEKIAHLRIFEDGAGKMNLSILDVHGSALVVSQFTLYADTRRGRRPAFTDAAPPEKANHLVKEFITALEQHGLPTQSGVFGASMQVSLINDGPVTILLEM